MVRLAQILPDLFSLEVNTILKNQMSAQKMPSLPHALHDIIRMYAEKLESYGVDLHPFFDHERIAEAEKFDEKISKPDSRETLGKPDLGEIFKRKLLRPYATKFVFTQVKNGWISFEIIRLIAVYLQTRPDLSAEVEPQILERLRRNCDQLTYILRTLWINPGPSLSLWQRLVCWWHRVRFVSWRDVLNKTRGELLDDDLRTKRLPLADINTEDLSRIRKIWEMGTERVLAQTVIQIDGDVVTRLAEALYDKQFGEHRESLLKAHRQSIDVSLTHWHGLAKLAVEVIGSTVKAVTGR